jgi:LacI family transcriptional regulator
VDRVLNGRSGVRRATIDRVTAAIERIGYVRDTSAANLARQRQYTFAVVLPEGPSLFVDSIRAALREAYSSQLADRVVLRVVSVPPQDPHAIVRTLKALDLGALDGIALMVPETPQVRDAIARIKQGGLAVVTFASDLPSAPRDFFVGIDNVKAGRTAALLKGKFLRRAGEILVVTNSIRARDSLERRLGFDAVMQRDFPHLTVLPTLESFDDPERMEETVLGQLIRRPRLVGIYSMGSGNQFVRNALRRSARGAELSVIVHELTPPTRAGLLAGEIDAVISQNVGHLVRGTLRVLRSLSDGVPIFEAQERIRIDILMRENLP